MKKLLSLALACTLTLGLASCGGTGTSTSSNAPASSSAVESPPPNSMPPLICLEIIQSSPRMVLPIHCPSAMRCRNPQRATKCFWP